MGLINLRGLKGLIGLTSNEYKEWKNSQLKAGNLHNNSSFQDEKNLYSDLLFLLYFDNNLDLFNSLTRDERKKMLLETASQEAFDNKYKGVASDDEYNLWNTLSAESKLNFLDSDILTSKLLENLILSILKSPLLLYTSGPQLLYDVLKSAIESLQNKNKKKIEDIFELDRKIRLEEALPIANLMTLQWQLAIDNGQMDYSAIEEEFNKISPYLNHYKAFLGEEELKRFSFEDKMNAVALYYAILQLTGNAGTALSVVDGGILNYIADLLDGWDKTKLFLGNLVTGTTGAVMAEFNGYLAALAGLYGTATGKGFEEGVNEFLNSNYALYWDGVDTFNSFSSALINKARENGGVSPNQRIKAVGEEFDILSLNTLYDGMAMAKFIIPALITKSAVGLASKGATRVARGAMLLAVKLGLNPTAARTAMGAINGTIGAAGALATGVGISNAYAMGTFNEVLAEENLKINSMVDNAIEDRIQTLTNSYRERGFDPETLTELDWKNIRLRISKEVELELNVEELRKLAELKATDAYIMNASLEAPRMALENALFRKWMLSKGTKANLGMDNPYLRVAEQEGNLTMMNKWLNRLKPVLNNIWGGFESNYLDDVTARFGKEFGLANFNNYIVENYDPELYVGVIEGYMNPLLAAASGAGEAFGETQSFWDGFIGAAGSIVLAVPSGRWAKRIILNKLGKKAEGEVKQGNRTFLEKLNDFIYNPILLEVEEAMARERNTSDKITRVNNYIKNHESDIQDVVNLAIGDSRAVLGLRSGDMLTAADEKTKQLFKLVLLYRGLTADPISSEHSQVKQMTEMLERINNSESIEDISDLVETSMARPENLGTHPVTAEDTYNSIKDNAKRFTEMTDKLAEIDKMLDENFDSRGVSLEFRNLVSYQLVMDLNWLERLDKITLELNLSPSSSKNLSAFMGGRKGFDARERELARVVENLLKEIDDTKAELEELNWTYTKPKTNKNGETTPAKKVKNRGNRLEKALLKKTLETLESAKQEALARLDEIRTFDPENAEVITADLMSTLNLEDLATLTDPENRGYYSNALLVLVDKFMSDLKMVDPQAELKILDANTLLKRIDSNKEAYSRIIISPLEAEKWIRNTIAKSKQAAASIVLEKEITQHINNIALMLNTNPLSIPRMYSADLLLEFIKRNPSMLDTILPLMEASLLISDMSNYIELLEDLDDTLKRLAKLTIFNLTNGVGNPSDVVTKLENALLSDAIDGFGEEIIDRALKKAELLGLLRSATIDRTKRANRNRVSSNEETSTTTQTTPENTSRPTQTLTLTLNTPTTNETIEDTSVAPENIVETTEDVLIPTEGEVAASENTITTPDIDKVGDKYLDVSLSDEVLLFDILEIPQELLSTLQELADKITSVLNPAVDNTDEGNIVTEVDPQVLTGNKYPGYDYKVAEEDAILQLPVSELKDSRMNAIHQWLASIKTNLQDIIDNELTRILKVSPKIYFMGTKYTKMGDHIYDSLFLVVEYTPEVAKIHNDNNGGIINTNGKLYLIVGTTGFNQGNRELLKYYQLLLKDHKAKRHQFFTLNSKELYFVDESKYTERKDATSGRRIRQLSPDLPVLLRKVSELLVDDPTINPFGFTSLNELSWGILYYTGYKKVKEPTTGIAYHPTDATSNAGSVFINMEAANGNFIPIYIAPTLYTDVEEGSELKDRIDETISQLFSPNLGERLIAESRLRMLFSLEKEGKWILVGNEKHNTITFLDHDVEVAKIDLDNPSLSSSAFMEAFKVFNPRLSITTSILGNKTALRMYNDAGALKTDIAKLGTSASGYTIYPVGQDGTPIKTEPPVNGRPNLDARSDLAKALAKQGMTEFYQGTLYRKRNGLWLDDTSNKPISLELAEEIEYSNKIRDLEPDLTAPGKSFYVLNNDRSNPVIIRKGTDGKVRLLNTEESIKVLNRIAKDLEEALRKAALEEALKAEYDGKVPTEKDTLVNLEDVDLGLDLDDLIASQLTGNFNLKVEKPEALSETDTPTLSSEESVLSSENINDTSEVSLSELQLTKTATSAAGIAASREHGDRLFDIVEAKLESGEWKASEDILDDYVALTKFLESKGIKVENIDNVEDWLNLIENCK